MIDVMENIKKLSAALDAETASLHPSGKLLLLGSQDSVFLKAIKRKADQLGINCDHTSNPLPPYRGIVVDSETVSFNSILDPDVDIDHSYSPGMSAVSQAVMDLLIESGLVWEKDITIVGRGHAVKELAKYLDFNNATVTVAHSKTKSLLQATQNRDVVIYATPIITQDTMMLSNPKLHRYNIIWDKVLKSGFLNAKKMPLREHEDIMVFYKSPPPYHPQMTVGEKNHTKGKAVGKQAEDVHSNRSYGNYTLVESPDGNMKYPASIWRFPKPHPSVALHATEKPVDLLRYAIRTYTDRNAIVLDNCCGTGSTLIAAKLEGRRYIGIDNGVCDKKKSPYYGMPWAQVAQIRLEAIDHEPADEPERHRPLGEGTTEGVCTPSGVSA